MLDFIYGTLAAIGFMHPLHPVATHIPMGMVLGGFVFLVASYKWGELEKTAFHCFILALLFVPPTILLGLMDWQHRLLGRWSNLIAAKISLSIFLAILLSTIVFLHFKKSPGKTVMLLLFGLAFLIAAAMGYIGGELVFG